MQVWVKRTLALTVALAAIYLLVRYRVPLLAIISDQERLRAWLAELGPLGPLGLIALNAAQVVVAPVPGYVVQIVAGYLFGWPAGTLYAIIGMALGGILAMSLARVFGRPLVRRLIGDDRLTRWEHMAHLNSLPIWFILMLGPFGDVPYFIAGLTSLAIWKVVAVAVFVRAPTVLVAAAVGSGAISWRSPWVIGGFFALIGVAIVAVRNQARIERWVDEKMLARVMRSRAGGAAPDSASAADTHEPMLPLAAHEQPSLGEH